MPFDIDSLMCRGGGRDFLSYPVRLIYLFEMNPCCLKSFSPSEIIAWLSMDPFVAVVMCPLLLLALLYFNKPLPVISPGKMSASSSELINSIHHSFHLLTIAGRVSERGIRVVQLH